MLQGLEVEVEPGKDPSVLTPFDRVFVRQSTMWILQRQEKPANPEEKEKDLQTQALSSYFYFVRYEFFH